MSRRLFIDVETTGLDEKFHEIVEVAWAFDEGDIFSFRWPHKLTTPNPQALKVCGYLERELYDKATWGTYNDLSRLSMAVEGATLVCSNPSFDERFLREKFRESLSSTEREEPLREPWSHRKVDIATYAMAKFGWDKPRGLEAIIKHLNMTQPHMVDIPLPNHTAAQDVLALRLAFHTLEAL